MTEKNDKSAQEKEEKAVDEKIKEEALKAYGRASQVKQVEKPSKKDEKVESVEKEKPQGSTREVELIDEELASINLELEQVKAERDDFLDHLRRLKAEFENYKKRLVKEQTMFIAMANEEVIFKLLSVVDNLERALQFSENQGDENFEKTLAGFRLIYNQLIDLLEKEGLEEIKAEGKPFDPEFHEALISEESEMEPNTVTQVLEKGYLFKGKVLRPAKVKIAR